MKIEKVSKHNRRNIPIVIKPKSELLRTEDQFFRSQYYDS